MDVRTKRKKEKRKVPSGRKRVEGPEKELAALKTTSRRTPLQPKRIENTY